MGDVDDLDFTPEGIERLIDASADHLDDWYADRGITTTRRKYRDALAASEATVASLRAEVERLTKALDLGKAIEAAALTWCGQKDRETSMSDIEYFRQNWSALPGLCAYVDRELGSAARALRSPSVDPGNG